MKPQELEIRISLGYKQLAYAYTQYYLAEKHYQEAKRVFEDKKATAIANGTLEGKNVAERDYSAQQEFKIFYDDMLDMEQKSNRAKLVLTRSQLEVDEIRALLRVEEIKVGRLPDAGH